MQAEIATVLLGFRNGDVKPTGFDGFDLHGWLAAFPVVWATKCKPHLCLKPLIKRSLPLIKAGAAADNQEIEMNVEFPVESAGS